MDFFSLKEKFKAKIKILKNYLRHYFKLIWLPIALIIIFVLQSNIFNVWLGISTIDYLIRRTIVSAAFGLLIFGPAVLMGKRIKYLYLILMSLIVSIIFLIQFLYYSYSGGFLQISALFYIREGMTVLGTVKVLLTYQLLLFILGPVTVLVAWTLRKHPRFAHQLTLLKKEKIAAGILIIIFSTLGYGYIFLRENMEAGTTAHLYQRSKLYDTNALVSKIGIINFSLEDALNFTLQADRASATEIDFAKSWIQEQPKKIENGKNFGLAKGRNLIIIQVESLENAVIGEKINGQEITPRLNQLAKAGLYFPNYYAQIGPGTTADAEFSTLTSLYPLPDKVVFIEYAFQPYNALPWLLKNNGYHTYALHGDLPSFWNRANIYPQLGYEKWFGRQEYTIPRSIGNYDLGDEDFFNQSLPKLQDLPRPFMATLITLTSHSPFELPDDLKKLSIPATTTFNVTQQNYLQSAHYADGAIGDFVDKLKTNGLYDNSLIVIFGDHGSFSGVGNALGARKAIFSDLQNSQVPLIIIAGGSKLRGINNSPGSHIDLFPTLANLLGIKATSTLLGQDLLNTNTPIAVMRNLVSGTIKIFVTDKLAYHTAVDGKFEHGTCVGFPKNNRIDVENCRAWYEKEKNIIKISDLMIKEKLLEEATK